MPSRGRRGELIIKVAKDRPGVVRGRTVAARRADRLQDVARVEDKVDVPHRHVVGDPVVHSHALGPPARAVEVAVGDHGVFPLPVVEMDPPEEKGRSDRACKGSDLGVEPPNPVGSLEPEAKSHPAEKGMGDSACNERDPFDDDK